MPASGRDSLLGPRVHVTGADIDDPVGVDGEGNFNAWHPRGAG